MRAHPTLPTSRLLLRPIAVDDAASLHEAMSDPIAMEYWREPPHESVDVTRRVLEGMATEHSAHWSVVERDGDRAIGFVGFHSTEPPHGFGYLLDRRYWRRGYMREACRAALEHAFGSLGFRQAEAWIHEENHASLALAAALGFRQVGTTSRRRMPHSRAAFRFLIYGVAARDMVPGAAPLPEGVACHQIEPTLPVADVQRSIDFYTEALGFSLAFQFGEPPVHAAVSSTPWSTGARIRLRRLEPGQALTYPEEVILTLDDFEAFHLRCAPRGIASSIEKQPWGSREFFVLDPDGHKLRFMGW